MTRDRYFIWVLLLLALPACQRSSAPPAAPPPPAPPPQAAAPPPPPQPPAEDRSLAFLPLDVNKFTMESIQANKKSIPDNPKDDKPQHAEALTQLGHANYMIQQFPKARDYYARAVHANGKALEARLGLSNCDALLGQIDEAIAQIDALLAVDKNYPEALYNQGLLRLYGKQDKAGARKAWEQLVASHPDSEWARRASAQLGRLS